LTTSTSIKFTINKLIEQENMSLSVRKQDLLGGLHHLMEAATALSDLVNSKSTSSDNNNIGNVNSTHTSTTRQSKRVVSDDEDEAAVFYNTECPHTPPPSAALSPSFVAVNSKEIFPQRLMHILSQLSISHIITWLPQGRSFVIIDPDVFASKILPQFFSETTSSSNISPSTSSGSKSKNKKSTACKYPSFTRKLNRWGFRQISRGPDAGAFHHPLFQRENPKLCLEMVCQKSRRPINSKSKAADESGVCDSPDTSKLQPLQSMPSLTMKRDVSVNTITDTESYAPERKALPPKKRKLRHSQVNELAHNHHFPLPQESLSSPREKSHRSTEHIIFKSPLRVNSTTLKPKDDSSPSENMLNTGALKKPEFPSFHKSYLDSGAAQERSKEISEFLEKNLNELQRMNKAWGAKNVSSSQSDEQDILFQKLQGNLSDQINSILSTVKDQSPPSSQYSDTFETTNTTTNSPGLIESVPSQKIIATPVTPTKVLPKTVKDAKDNLYRAYLQALSS